MNKVIEYILEPVFNRLTLQTGTFFYSIIFIIKIPFNRLYLILTVYIQTHLGFRTEVFLGFCIFSCALSVRAQ